MRRRAFVLAACLLAAAACRESPPEPSAPDASAPVAPASAPAFASGSSSSAAAVPAGDAGEADGGRGAERAFCHDAFSADQARMKEKCSAADFGLTQTVSRAAGNLCVSDLASGLARSRATFDVEAARACVAMLTQKQLASTVEGDTIFLHPPCDRVVVGSQAEGAACRFSIECKDGLACVGYKIGADGTCTKPPKATEACTLQPFGTIITESAAALHHPACAPSAYCDGTTCQPRVASGKACGTSNACPVGLSCVMGKCGARGAAGAACGASSDCVFGLYCDGAAAGGNGTKGKCAAKRPEGQDCASLDACKGRCDIPKGPDGKPAPAGKCAAVCGSG
jgi:hypothetical protein